MAVVIDPPRGLFRGTDSAAVGDVIIKPQGFAFATQDADEEVYVVLRRAVITNFGWVYAVSLYAIIPVVVLFLLQYFNVPAIPNLPRGYAIVIPLLYYSALFTYALLRFNAWYYNLIIITNKRFITYSFKPLTTYKASETNLDNILDISQSTVGLFPSLFNYGELLVQTASERTKFKIRFVPRPTWVRNILVDLARMSKNPEP